MLSALRKSGETSLAFSESKSNAPFVCPECREEVILKTGPVVTPHFSHRASSLCRFTTNETEAHRRCKLEIFNYLLKQKNVTDVRLELPLGTNRPDVSARISGIPVAIEVQISNLSMETIIRRTSEYAKKGIYVLWLPQWSPALDSGRYSPRLWEKWVHAAYFGRAYYWKRGLEVVSYRFDQHLRYNPKDTWHLGYGKRSGVGLERISKRYRAPERREILNIADDFGPMHREPWRGGVFEVPLAKLFMRRSDLL
jgi:competence protein CoiA